jgi:hypothetical protein
MGCIADCSDDTERSLACRLRNGLRLADECGKVGLWLRAIFEVGSTFGFRLRELTGRNGLRVGQLDFLSNTIVLYGGSD